MVRAHLGNARRSLWHNTVQALPTLAERQRAQVRTIEPEQVEGHIGGRLSAPEKIVELGSAGRIGRDHLAVENRLVEAELSCKLGAELVVAAQEIAVARN